MTLLLKTIAIVSVTIFAFSLVVVIFFPNSRLYNYIEKHEFLKCFLVSICVIGLASILMWVN